MMRRRLTPAARRAAAPLRQRALGSTVGEREFPDLDAARTWIEEQGFRPLHGGGYERGRERVLIAERGGKLVVQNF